jgi:MoxR-like ATPase
MAELIGRSDAIGVLRAFTDRSMVFGGALIVVGEPGVGKTTVLGRAAADLGCRGHADPASDRC